MKRLLLAFLCLVPILVLAEPGNSIARLDSLLGQSTRYDRAKKKSIKTLYSRYTAAKSIGDKLTSCRSLFLAYCTYQYDSAYAYAGREQRLAYAMKDQSEIVIATSDKVFCLLSAGLYKEAADEIQKVSPEGINFLAKANYYFIKWRLFADMSDYVHTQPYQ